MAEYTKLDLHNHHKKHRNILYMLVVLLLVFQLTSFVFMSIQFIKLNTTLEFETNRIEKNLTGHFTDLINEHDSIYQRNFNEVTIALAQQAEQQKTFEEQIEILKSPAEDFSAVAEDTIKGVVAVLTETSIGSGFILTSDGYIVTNYHVIEKGVLIKVLTYDKKIINAKVLGTDKLRDLALLKIEGNYNYLKLADSDKLQVGRKVIAIGNPHGLSFTVTEGIISALDRQGPNGIEEYVQTDVSLNPGNSGGPLVDTKGEVIGINNFKIGGAESLGFALESNSVRKAINAILGQDIIE